MWRCRFGVELEDPQLLVLNAVALFVALKIILTLVGGSGGTVLEWLERIEHGLHDDAVVGVVFFRRGIL